VSSAVLAPPLGALWLDEEEAEDSYFEPFVASSEADSASDEAASEPLLVQQEFDFWAEELAAESIVVSSTRRLRSHPAFVGILALGKPAVPYLLERLRTGEGRPVWLSLLGLLTELPPAAGAETIEDATKAWLRWEKTELVPASGPGATTP